MGSLVEEDAVELVALRPEVNISLYRVCRTIAVTCKDVSEDSDACRAQLRNPPLVVAIA